MILDNSAVMAVLKGEAEAESFVKAIAAADRCAMSAASWVELAAVCMRGGSDLEALVARFAERVDLHIISFDLTQAEIARTAYRIYGRGTGHPAALNFGDCFAYALARATGEPLLFKGADFALTDVVPAMRADD